MAQLATRCTACGTVFRVVRDQLRVAEGLVRCGRCGEVFNAAENLVSAEELQAAQVPVAAPPAAPPLDSVDLGLSVGDPPADTTPSPWANLDLADPPAPPPPAPAPDDFDLAFDGVEVPPAVDADADTLAQPLAPSVPVEAMPAAAAVEEPAAEPVAQPLVEPIAEAMAEATTAPADAPVAMPLVAGEAPPPVDAPGAAPDLDLALSDADGTSAEAAADLELPLTPEAMPPVAEGAPAAALTEAVAEPVVAPEAAPWDELDLRAERDAPASFELDLPDLRAVDPPAAPEPAAALPPEDRPVTAADESATSQGLLAPEAVEAAAALLPEPAPDVAITEAARAAAETEQGMAVDLSDAARALAAAEVPGPVPSAAAAPLPTVDDLTPSFLQGPPPSAWDRPAARRSAALACVAATVALAAQAVYTFRDAVAATVPALREPLVRVCEPLACRVSPERHLAGLAVDGSSLLRVERSNLYQLQLTVRNRSLRDVALPALDLTLNNAQGQVVSRRVVTLAELGVTDTTLAAGRALQVQATLQTLLKPAESVAGYTLDLFYP